jgi:hypothetical protein
MAAETTPQALCLTCGICCEGTLFSHVPLKAADALLPLQAGGIAIGANDAGQFFNLPCAAHREGCCQVYASRPIVCRKYRCELLGKYESGTSSWAESQQKIGHVQMLKKMIGTELERILPEGGRLDVMAVRRRLPTREELASDADLRKIWAPVMLLLAALLDCLHTHFQPPRKENASTPGPPLT